MPTPQFSDCVFVFGFGLWLPAMLLAMLTILSLPRLRTTAGLHSVKRVFMFTPVRVDFVDLPVSTRDLSQRML